MTKANLYLIGLPGAGKSTLGRLVADDLGWAFVDLDSAIEGAQGMAISRLFAQYGEPHFRALEHEALVAASAAQGQVIATGGGIILDPGNVSVMRATGQILWLDRPLEGVLSTLRQDTRPLLAGDAAQRLSTLDAARRPLYAAACHLRVPVEGTPEAVASAIVTQLKEAEPLCT